MEVVAPKGLKSLEMLLKHDFVPHREEHALKMCAHIRISDHIFLCICGWDVRNFRCTKKHLAYTTGFAGTTIEFFHNSRLIR